MGIAHGPPGKPDKANRDLAFKEARRLRQAHRGDAVLLEAYAIAARELDDIYGDLGMEGALAEMIHDLAAEKRNVALGPYIAARQWVAAGRPDRARQELKASKDHIPSLVLATQLAVADEDWPEVAEDLKLLGKLKPDAIELPLWPLRSTRPGASCPRRGRSTRNT